MTQLNIYRYPQIKNNSQEYEKNYKEFFIRKVFKQIKKLDNEKDTH